MQLDNDNMEIMLCINESAGTSLLLKQLQCLKEIINFIEDSLKEIRNINEYNPVQEDHQITAVILEAMMQLENLKHEISQNNIATICENRQNFNTDDNKENIILQENINKLQNDIQNALTDLIAPVVPNQAEIDCLKQLVARLESDNFHLTEQLTASTAEHKSAVKQSSSVTDEVESIRVALESFKIELKEEIIDLECVMDERDAMITELHTALERLTSEHDQLQLNNSALIDQLNSSVERAAECRAELKSMENATAELREDKCRLADELATRTRELESSVMYFLALSDDLEANKDQHFASEAQLTRDIAKLHRTLAEKNMKIFNLHTNLHRLEERVSRTNELQMMCNAYSVDLRDKVSEIHRLSNENSMLMKQEETRTDVIHALEIDLQQRLDGLASFERRCDTLSADLVESISRVDILTGENASLMVQDETRAGVIQALEINLQQRLEELARLTDQLSDLNSRLSNTQLEHEHTLNELNTRLSISAALTERLSIENTELKRQIDELASRDKW